MKTIKLLGKLGQRFGREFQMHVNSPAEAIKSLCYQLPGFQQYLYRSSDEFGIQYRVIVETVIVDDAGKSISVTVENPEGRSKEELAYPIGCANTIVIAPVPSGSGGFGRILLGAVLIGAALAFPAGILGISSTAIGVFGGAMFIKGVGNVLAKQEKTPKDRDKQDSYLFDQANEAGKQGQPVPVLIGERIVELSIVLSSGLTTNEIPVG